MLQGKHSAILSTFIKLPYVINKDLTFVYFSVAVLNRFYCINVAGIEYMYCQLMFCSIVLIRRINTTVKQII